MKFPALNLICFNTNEQNNLTKCSQNSKTGGGVNCSVRGTVGLTDNFMELPILLLELIVVHYDNVEN